MSRDEVCKTAIKAIVSIAQEFSHTDMTDAELMLRCLPHAETLYDYAWDKSQEDAQMRYEDEALRQRKRADGLARALEVIDGKE